MKARTRSASRPRCAVSLPVSSFLVALILGGCGAPEPAPEAPSTPSEPVVFTGLYEVKGVTSTIGSREQRDISGTVILVQDGSGYTSTFELSTTLPGGDLDIVADVIGTGRGIVEGRTLEGTAQTQLVASAVPGVDPGFAFIPRVVSTRIVSSTSATLEPDGSFRVEIESKAAEGSVYEPTRTKLVGRRVSTDVHSAFSGAAPQ